VLIWYQELKWFVIKQMVLTLLGNYNEEIKADKALIKKRKEQIKADKALSEYFKNLNKGKYE
jgi:hypothetical protein